MFRASCRHDNWRLISVMATSCEQSYFTVSLISNMSVFPIEAVREAERVLTHRLSLNCMQSEEN